MGVTHHVLHPCLLRTLIFSVQLACWLEAWRGFPQWYDPAETTEKSCVTCPSAWLWSSSCCTILWHGSRTNGSFANVLGEVSQFYENFFFFFGLSVWPYYEAISVNCTTEVFPLILKRMTAVWGWFISLHLTLSKPFVYTLKSGLFSVYFYSWSKETCHGPIFVV